MKTAIISVALPLDLLWKVEEFAALKGWKRSHTIGYLIHMGFTYLLSMEDQEAIKASEQAGF